MLALEVPRARTAARWESVRAAVVPYDGRLGRVRRRRLGLRRCKRSAPVNGRIRTAQVVAGNGGAGICLSTDPNGARARNRPDLRTGNGRRATGGYEKCGTDQEYS